jgi:hypothetical protein
MIKIQDLLQNNTSRSHILQLCVQLVEQEVQQVPGLSGLAVKTSYAVVKSLKPNMVAEVLEGLLDECARTLDPFVEKAWASNAQTAVPFFTEHATLIAQELLKLTDLRATRARNTMLLKIYEKLRPSALKHVEKAVPAIGQMLMLVLPQKTTAV